MPVQSPEFKKYVDKAASFLDKNFFGGALGIAEPGKKPIPEGIPYRKNRTLFSKEHTDESTISEIRILPEPVTAKEILGREIDEVRNRQSLKGLQLSKAPMRWAAIDRESAGTTEYFGVTLSSIDGKDLNKLLFSNATEPLFDLDSKDIWNDWGNIDAKSPDMSERKARHQGLGLAWEVFNRDRQLFRFLIGRDQLKNKKLLNEEPRPLLIPVMRWVNGPAGRSFIYDLPDTGSYLDLISDFLIDRQDLLKHLPEPQCYNPTIGILEIGHLDAEVRANWRRRYGYNQDDEKRGNGSTQAGVQTLRFDSPSPKWYRPEDGLLNGEFVRRTEELIEAKALHRIIALIEQS